MIALRGAEDVLVYGDYDLLCQDHERIYAYTRTLGDERALIVLNWSAEPTRLDSADVEEGIEGGITIAEAELRYSNYDGTPAAIDGHELRPYEALVYRL